jgi:hypothetical protein
VAERLIAPVLKTGKSARASGVRIPPSPPLQNRTANAEHSRFYAGGGSQRLKQIAFRADDADLAVRDLDALGERAEMVAAIAAAIDPDALARRPGEPLDHLRRDCLLA